MEALITLGHTDIWFSKVAVAIYKPISNMSRFHLPVERGGQKENMLLWPLRKLSKNKTQRESINFKQ